MKRLIIHQPTNHESKKYRYYNIFFDNLIERISKSHDVVTNRYYKFANHGLNKVKLNFDTSDSDFTVLLYECEMIIEDYDTKEIQVLSVADELTPAILNLQDYDKLKNVFVAQFIQDKIDHHVSETNRKKYSPWIYFPSNSYDFDFYSDERKKIENKNKKLFFRGDTRSRPILNFFNPEIFEGGVPIGGFEPYANQIINYQVALSIAGRGELCYRDVECFSMGIPILRFEYLSKLKQPLIPNYHYISVERPNDFRSWLNLDRNGNKEHAEMLIERYNQVKNDLEFLNFISENAKKYYKDYLSPQGSVEFTFNLLNL